MSKQGNMETNNICATEDTFEQFAQHFGSGEFITLSELVPTSYASNEVMDSIIMEVPSSQTGHHNVVNAETFAADYQHVQEINPSLSSGQIFAHNMMENVTLAGEDQHVSEQETNIVLPRKTYVVYNSNPDTQIRSTEKVSKKRGRKKKSPIILPKTAQSEDNSDLNFDMIIGEDDFLAPEPIQTPKRNVVKSLKTEVKTTTPMGTQSQSPNKKPRGRPPKNKSNPQVIPTSTVETKKKTQKRKSDQPAPLLTPTIESKRKHVLRKKCDSNIHSAVHTDKEGNFDITTPSIVNNATSGEFLDHVANEITITNEETKQIVTSVNYTLDMSSEIGGEVEIKTSETDDIDNMPLGQLSKVINKSVAEKNNKKEFMTSKIKTKIPKKKKTCVEDDKMDNISLSKLNTNKNSSCKNDANTNEQNPDITTTVKENVEMDATPLNDSQVDNNGETSKRPVRRRTKKILHYEPDSDEDPFANVELSDEEPGKGKRGSRYYSDDEYIPGIENKKRPDRYSDSDADDDIEFIKKHSKKKNSKSPKKKLIDDSMATNLEELDDIEGCLETSVIKLTESEQSNWGTTKEFENFLANKVGSDVFIEKYKSKKSKILPLEIPVLDPNEPKKVEHISTQTNVSTKNSSVQTDTQNHVSMVKQVKLTDEQSTKACEFLSNIVKTTAELGQLMTQKSEDFIEKKINTTHVTDTLKMDYCVKKSFLLFKLAKHNLIQMEEDLAKQYEDFLNVQNLSQYREERKVITTKPKDEDDSDCEIVEVTTNDKKGAKKKDKPAFNPRTVFLNKELSIKIAKKPSTPSVSADPKSAKSINIKGRHTVWINDSIMVKKVKTNQSFLAQDSRNKKPPDSQFVTLKMVNDFFELYNRQKVLSTCAPFVGCDWFTSKNSYCCYYSTEIVTATSSNCTLIANDTPIITIPDTSSHIKIPKPLLTLCIVVLKKLIKWKSKLEKDQSDMGVPITLNQIDCSKFSILINEENTENNVTSENQTVNNAECEMNKRIVKSLSVLCLQELQKNIYRKTKVITNDRHTSLNLSPEDRNNLDDIDTSNMLEKNYSNVKSLIILCLHQLQKQSYDKVYCKRKSFSDSTFMECCKIKSLSMLCLQVLQNIHSICTQSWNDTSVDYYSNSMDVVSENECYVENSNTNQHRNNVNNLQSICYKRIVELIFNFPDHSLTQLEPTIFNAYSLRPVDEVKSLFTLCTRYIQNIQYLRYKQKTKPKYIPSTSLALKCSKKIIMPKRDSFMQSSRQIFQVETLSRLCFELISSTLCKDSCSILNRKEINSKESYSIVLSLKKICLQKIITLMRLAYGSTDCGKKSHDLSITINEINTVSEDFFNNGYHSFDEDGAYDDTEVEIESNEESHYAIENNYNEWQNDENIPNENNEWTAHIQMGDLRSCADTRKNNEDHITDTYQEEISSQNPLENGILSNIKQELCEEAHYMPNIMAIIKTEPDEDILHQAVISSEPLHGITKTEHPLHEGIENNESLLFHRRNSYDVNAFEKFVSSNKLMYSLTDGGSHDEDEAYSQTFPRLRRQYEPDLESDEDNFDSLGLLIPQSVDQAKDRLMDSSSDEEGKKTKKNDKKKYTKKKGKLKKTNKEMVPIKSKNADDVAILTRKMKERLRQEESQENVSDTEDVPLIFRKSKSKNIPKTDKIADIVDYNSLDTLVEKEKANDSQMKNSYEIQCSNIDSTENLETTQEKSIRKRSKRKEIADDDNNDCSPKESEVSETEESSQYEKLRNSDNLELKPDNNDLDLRRSLRKNSKLHPKSETLSEEKGDESISKSNDALEDIASSYSKELSDDKKLEDQEPKQVNNDLKRSLRINSKMNHTQSETISNDITDGSILNDNDISENVESSYNEEPKDHENSETESFSNALDMAEPIELLECESTLPIFDTQTNKKQKTKATEDPKETSDTDVYVDTSNQDKNKEIVIRHGWECYPINHSDTKLYEHACIRLEKLPESFVDTYFKYINLDKEKDVDDIEIDRLTNLQTLNREKNKRECTRNSRAKTKTVSSDPSVGDTKIKFEIEADNADELSLSEDENDNTDNILPPLVEENDAENDLAKSLLIGDNDSETDDAGSASESNERRKSGPKSKTRDADKMKAKNSSLGIVKKENGADLLLTADRSMNSELASLHAPATGLTDQIINEKKDPTKKHKHPKYKTSSKSQTTTVHIRKDDDSSSEEEKQWFTTKEKLLKRLEKKQETRIIDETKRAKIVSEFIEKRREDGPVSQSVLRRPRRGRSNRKKLLERRKQMKVLTRELCGEDASSSKRYSQSYGKGRKNIRKVIDKKSLARNTVLANIEEFERKRRLSMREAQLKETLGFEEDVQVVVINGELCLEYDFERGQPAVAVHPFFTKVMKAHQYEGVKFMWDACFETVETVRGGGAGGGCILAHCMGLGKTLQVLALLHTVLTHPGVAMQRVLVCCPLSTVLNWVDEIHKWIGPVTNQIKVFELSKLKKTYERAYQLEDWYNGGGIFIIGYELFRSLTTLDPMLDDVRPTIVNKIRAALLDPGPDIIICDEGHLLKNDMSVLAVAMSRVVTKRRIVLTGTPMQNNLREYYCMVNFIKPNLLGTYAEYSNRFENPIMNGQHRDSMEEDIKLMKQRTHILHKVLEGCLQRQEASVLYPYLPKKYEYTVFISLTSCQWDLYKHYIAQSKMTSKGNKANVLRDFHVLQKIWSHPQVLHHFQTKGRETYEKIKAEKLEDELLRDELAASEDIKPAPTDVWWLQYLDGGKMLDLLDSSNKFLVVFRLLDECVALGDKVLIFSTSLYALDALEYFLRVINGWALGQDYYRLDGAVPPEVRQKWCREFNDEGNTHTKLFLISTRAGCLGLNMTAANRVIILDTSWNPAHDIQSIFRVYRFGQKKDCFIYRLVALGTMEQKMYERSVTKQAVACRVVDEQQIDRHYNMAELSELYCYDEEGSSVGAGLAAGVRDAALLRVAAALQARAGALHAVREHDSLLRDTDARLPEHERAAAWQQFQQEHAEEKPLVKIPKKCQLKVSESESTADFKPARKRGRPRKISPEPSQPSTSALANIISQEVAVDKIRELLIKHNAVDAAPADLTRMIGEVRQYIEDPTKDISSNPLVEKIAQVLLKKTIPTSNDCLELGPGNVPEEPKVILGDCDGTTRDTTQDEETVLCDSESTLSDTEFQDKRRKRPKVDDDYLPPLEKKKKKSGRGRKTIEIPPPVKTTRRSRDAKYAAETIHNQDDDNDYSVELTGVHTIDDGVYEDTIDISDDDTEAEKTPAPATKEPPKTSALPDDILLPPKESGECIPLPKSLLTDKKFIKIVAHMYVSSSPILDEDAATRAAEYSTSKALREINETGEKILSGNLHEIALKVYGPEALKKLNRCEANDDSKKKAADVTAEGAVKPIILKKGRIGKDTATQEKTACYVVSSKPIETDATPKPQRESQSTVARPDVATTLAAQLKATLTSKTVTPIKPMKATNSKFKVICRPISDLDLPTTSNSGPTPARAETAPTPAREESAQAPAAVPQRVVPVGMFTGAGTLAVPNSREESILPDDDDIIVIPLEETPQPASSDSFLRDVLAKPQVLPKQDTGRRLSQPMVINRVSTSSSSTTPACNTLGFNSVADKTVANNALPNTIVNVIPSTQAKDTNKKTYIDILPKLAPAAPLPRTYLIKTSDLKAALAKYPSGSGQIHIDSGKIKLPISSIIKQLKQSNTAAPAETTSSVILPHAGESNVKVTPNKSTAPKAPTTQTAFDLICLDSDDEDTNTSTVASTKTNTSTVASTKTNTSTVASTKTNTSTVARTKTNTSTVASTKTNTSTVASTKTNTSTVASTKTNTSTVASTKTNTSTVASTKTNTSTVARTKTNTSTVASAKTNTSTVASTKTNTSTVASTKKLVPPVQVPPRKEAGPARNPEPKQAAAKAEVIIKKKAEPKIPVLGSSKPDVKLSKQPEPNKSAPVSDKSGNTKSIANTKNVFDKYKNKIVPPRTSTAKEQQKPKKAADTKPTEQTYTVMFDNGASIEIVSISDKLAPATTSTPSKPALGSSLSNEKKPEKSKTEQYKPKPKSKQSPRPQVNLGMIDLTSFESLDQKKAPSVVKASPSKPISGTSVDIFITNAGKLSTDKVITPSKNVDLTGGDVTSVINVKPSTSVKRTKKPEVSVPVKKAKVEIKSKPSSALKSLMDLTFDDIDDIVELE